MPSGGRQGGRRCESGEVVVDPATIDGDVDPAELARVSAFLDTHLRGKYEHRKHQTCMYTMTPDEHFILDFHPDDHRIVVGCGFSGHGFKFAPVVGEVLAKLATSGTYCAETQFLLRRHT